jgi:hypothetical protein
MEGYCSTGQSPQRAVVPVEEEEEEDWKFTCRVSRYLELAIQYVLLLFIEHNIFFSEFPRFLLCL